MVTVKFEAVKKSTDIAKACYAFLKSNSLHKKEVSLLGKTGWTEGLQEGKNVFYDKNIPSYPQFLKAFVDNPLGSCIGALDKADTNRVGLFVTLDEQKNPLAVLNFYGNADFVLQNKVVKELEGIMAEL